MLRCHIARWPRPPYSRFSGEHCDLGPNNKCSTVVPEIDAGSHLRALMDLDAEATYLPEAHSGPEPSARIKREPAWESHYADLRKFVVRQLGAQQDADDVVQDIYGEVLRSRCTEVTNPRAWLWKIAWRVLNEAFQRRHSQRRRQVILDPESIEFLRAERASTVAPVDRGVEAEDELRHALKGLPVAAQIVIVRSRCDGWNYEQIAAELGISTNMVKKYIVKAVAHFEDYFERADGKNTQKDVKPVDGTNTEQDVDP